MNATQYNGGEVMLISFTVKNVLSFKEETTLDMRASGIKAHGYSLIDEGNHKLLPVAAIYGANASGKTNLINALSAALKYIAGREEITAIPFLFGLKEHEPIENYPYWCLRFEIKTDGKPTECEYSFNAIASKVYYEELKCADAGTKRLSRVYLREWDNGNGSWRLTLGKARHTKQLNKAVNYVNELEASQNKLFLSALGQWAASSGQRGKYALFEGIYDWSLQATLFEEPWTEKFGRPGIIKGGYIDSFMSEKKNRKDFNSFMHMINPMISGFNLTDIKAVSNEQGGERLSPDNLLSPVFEYHNSADSSIGFNLSLSGLESRGVWTAMSFYPRVHQALNRGGILIADELENSLHPLLMARIVNLFTSRDTNPAGGQLIFTTHNALMMNKNYFRQDEIVFVEKDEEGVSTLYRLSDIEGIRSDLDFCKNYILGAFGAVPEFSDTDGGADA